MGKKKQRSSAAQALEQLRQHFTDLEAQIAELQAQINHPDRPASERKALKARWTRMVRSSGLEWFFPESSKQTHAIRKSSQDWLSEALCQKTLAQKFKAAGDAKRSQEALSAAKSAERNADRVRQLELRGGSRG